MNAVRRRFSQAECAGLATLLNDGEVVCAPSGALYVPSEDLLVVSDLHLEKGAAFARRGMLLPPYDTAATLALLEHVVERYGPARVICLGDSFHDRHGASLMPAMFRDRLNALVGQRDWVWIAGNHDPERPAGLGGDIAEEVTAGRWIFRHEPSSHVRPGEVAGHLHPAARVAGNGRSVRGACFASDMSRMVMPSFGITTGGLNVLDRAFARLFTPERATAYVIGTSRIYPISFRSLCPG